MLPPIDDAAVAAPINFAVGGGILIAIIGSLLVTTQGFGIDSSQSDDQNLRAEAKELVDLLTSSSGEGWESGPDSVTGMGLLNENGSGLDASRIGVMKGAQFDAAANGKLDYNETLVLLGLDPAGVDHVHVRIAPVGLQHVLTSGLGNIPTLYIADFDDPDTSIDVTLGTEAEMLAAARAAIEVQMSAEAAIERYGLEDLGLGFDNTTSIDGWDVSVDIGPGPGVDLSTLVNTSGLAGDIFPDQKQYLNDMVPGVIDDYRVVIIGSNVDHAALTSNAFKQAIEDWIYAGGTIIVFGSDSQSFQWLESIMAVGIETVNGGAFAPDVDHPVLREPYQLDWPAYQNFEQGWGGKTGQNNNFDDLFQHIITDDDGDVLAVSLDGAFGEGRVFLSTYRPAQISQEISLQEAMNFVNNIVVYSDRSRFFLDYGPAPPQDVSVGASSRLSYVWDDDLGQVPVRVTVLTWGT